MRWALRDSSQITELACQGNSYPAIRKKVQNQETELLLLASKSRSLNGNLEIMMPHPYSYCLQSHTAPAKLTSNKIACPASSTLATMELVAGY